ncbi:hypothetical protein A1O3_08666 [Capronia epimyces CBS 606.96]|uniref:Fumarylacetoacetase-like C-terminal domain-containing protein n=1 Tax=Capronia epimyces CBS 606.96 TaxID=1182542 RepID=W9XPA1_9EURO|nr:uncharacterized protein A1O3_08666 [Capronia epimyces CBS 606.96]EXJ79165.1 hypothetical protein A1O3_08666 [Capronia epimyces CBS 606.96]
MSSSFSWSRLIRFVDENGAVRYGDVVEERPASEMIGTKVDTLDGDPFGAMTRTHQQATVTKILCPLESTPIFMCIGLNYRQHANEANLTIAEHPVVFTKPADALNSPLDDVTVFLDIQSQLDYEGELCVIIGKDGKNIPEAEALDYVLGYAAGNDVSARKFQLPPFSGGQFCYGKSFDGFAPVGPCIVSKTLIADPQTLDLVTRVDGELRQQTSTADMIWTVKQIIAHLSRGTTLRKGTIIMTGTPSGVGLFTPNGLLKDGSVVEVSISRVGSIQNKMVFE